MLPLVLFGAAHLLLVLGLLWSFRRPGSPWNRRIAIVGILWAMSAPLMGVVGASASAAQSERTVHVASPLKKQEAIGEAIRSSIIWVRWALGSMPTLLLLGGTIFWRDLRHRKEGSEVSAPRPAIAG